MSENIAITEEQILTLRAMYKAGRSREEMAESTGKSLKDLGEVLNTYHIVGEMPVKDYDKEMDFSESIYEFWGKLGYHIEMNTTLYGYNRSDMVNGLPSTLKKYKHSKNSEIKSWTQESLTSAKTKQ